MYALDVAIQAFWTANATALASITGGISADLQPPGATMPYVVTSLPPAQGGSLVRAFKTEFNRTLAEPCVVQMSVFAIGRDNASQAAELVASVFDDAKLMPSGKTAVQCVRSRAIIVTTGVPGNPDVNAKQIWQGILFYNILVCPN